MSLHASLRGSPLGFDEPPARPNANQLRHRKTLVKRPFGALPPRRQEGFRRVPLQHVLDGSRDGQNNKGLVGFDHRTKKPVYDFYREEWGE